MSPLTILHLAANRWWTGSADPILRLASALRDRGHRVLLGMIPGDRFESKAREAGLPLLDGVSLAVRFTPLTTLRDLRTLRRVVEREGVQVIHSHHSHDHWLGGLCRRGAALVRTFHNVRAVRRRWPSTALYRRTDCLIAVTRPIGARCLEAGIPPERLRVIGGLLDLDRFPADLDGRGIREEFHLGAAPVVGSVARLAPSRGHELLIRGFQELLRTLPEARLLLVGKGEARPKIERLVDELELSHRVIFTGYRDRDLPQVLAAMDCFALMGAGSDESCRAALEAMAAGKPVVARKVGALPETVIERETGLLLEDESPECLARSLFELLKDRERGRRMGEAGRRRVESEFSPSRRVLEVEAVYLAGIERARRGSR